MAYRRRQQLGKETSFREEIFSAYTPPPPLEDATDNGDAFSSQSGSSMAAKAIRASAAHRGSSLSSAYAQSPVSSRTSDSSLIKDTSSYKYVPRKTSNEHKQGFWGVLARKTKSILDDNATEQHETLNKPGFQSSSGETSPQYDGRYQSSERHQMSKSPTLQKGLGAITSSLDYIGGRIGNALEEGRSVVENRTADIFQEAGKFQMKRKGNAPVLDQLSTTRTNSQMDTDIDTQLKASRDVAMAMAAKAKLLLRELKTVKVDLAFAKDRCAQLEEENKLLRESREKGESPDDDELIRLQLESLLAEKARLAQENSVLARENRFLREIVEYHQLTMQDIVYLDENSEEFTEIYPARIPSMPNLQSLDSSLHSPSSSNRIHTQLSKDDSFLAFAPVNSEGTS